MINLSADKSNASAFRYNCQVFEQFNSICSPLFDHLGIKYFRYTRTFDDGSYFSLGSNLSYMQYYFQNIQSLGEVFGPLIASAPETSYYSFLWPESLNASLKYEDSIFPILQEFNIWNGVTLYKRAKDFTESWNFAGNKEDNNLKQLYLNNLPLLKNFTKYFIEKATDLIDCSDIQKLAFFKSPVTYNSPLDILSNKEKANSFLEATKREQFYVTGKNKCVIISNRELDCLRLFARGRTMKEIAKNLNLSPRTAECYINNIKLKTGIHYKSALIASLEQDISLDLCK
ncbi:MAG: helix-turn-helix transcriptional regulator [Silvanigrellaceae bacterium]|nr:helix-turn-helix transcriptional regulator [Silvanigrellaceae bacterium]